MVYRRSDSVDGRLHGLLSITIGSAIANAATAANSAIAVTKPSSAGRVKLAGISDQGPAGKVNAIPVRHNDD